MATGWDYKNPDYDSEFRRRIASVEKMRALPGGAAALKEYYRDKPIAFIDDWGLTFDPRLVERGLPASVPFVLFDRQAEFLEWVIARWRSREHGLVEKSRDMGVSWLCVAAAVWLWLFQPGMVVGFGSRKETYVDDIGNPNSLFWKIRHLIGGLPVEFRPAGWDEKKHAPFMRIQNPENGAVIVGEAGANIGRGARTGIYFVDEAAFLEQPDAIDAALSQTTNCRIDVSTPNGAGNPFYRKRHGGKIPVFTFDWRSDPRKDQDWYERQVATLDPVVVAQEIDRNYESSISNAFIPGETVLAAASRGPADVQPVGGLRIGIDVARFGDDKSVISIRRGRALLKQVEVSKLDVTQVAGRARSEIAAYGETPEQIAVDTIGIGAGVADMLRRWYPDRLDHSTGRKAPIVQDVNAALRMSDGEHYNLRAYMWSQMREWLKTGSIPTDAELRVQLSSLRYHYKGAEMLLESKDDAKRRGVKSPDRADSLALTFAYPAAPKAPASPKPLQPYRVANSATGVLG